MPYSKYTTAKADRALMRAVLKAEGKPKRRRASTAVAGFTRTVGNMGRRGEMKNFDAILPVPVNLAASANILGGYFFNFSETALPAPTTLMQGTSPNQRVGRNIVVKSIEVNFNIQINRQAAGVPSPVQYRLDLIQDTQCNGGPYVGVIGAQVYEVVVGQQPTQAFFNLSNGSRFKLLKRVTGQLDNDYGVAQATGTVIEKQIRFTKRCNIPVTFDTNAAGAGALANIKTNNIFLLLTFEAAIAVMDPYLTGGCMRTLYVDA